MNRTHKGAAALAGIAAVAAALTACTGGKGTETSQVVARVDDSEITISQLRAALAGKGEAQATPEDTRRALDGLVNEQLLVAAALRNKLDRDPVVVQTVEGARRQILARAYLERTVFPKQEISAADQSTYYKSHPALFSQRRVYQLTAFTFPSALVDEAVAQELDAASSAEAVTAVLAKHQIDAQPQTLTRAAEQLPLEQLPAFASAAVGDAIMQAAEDGHTTLMVVTGIQHSPLGFESAQPIIQQYLANMRNAEALDAHLRLARAGASITHLDASLQAANPPPPSVPAGTDGQSASIERGAAVLN